MIYFRCISCVGWFCCVDIFFEPHRLQRVFVKIYSRTAVGKNVVQFYQRWVSVLFSLQWNYRSKLCVKFFLKPVRYFVEFLCLNWTWIWHLHGHLWKQEDSICFWISEKNWNCKKETFLVAMANFGGIFTFIIGTGKVSRKTNKNYYTTINLSKISSSDAAIYLLCSLYTIYTALWKYQTGQ